MLCLLCWALLLMAGTYENKVGGISIWFPDDWEVVSEEELISADAPDGDAFTVLEVLDDVDELSATLDIYGDVLEEYIEDFETQGDPQETEVNGLPAYLIKGQGVVEDEPWNAEVVILQTGKAFVMVVNSASADQQKKYSPIFEQVVRSLKKI
jgi:hypothetical protein